MPQTIQEFREQIERPEREFFDALTIAEIYLDSETSQLMHVVLGSIRQMSASIWLRLPEIVEKIGKHEDAKMREPNWKLFGSSFDATRAKLASLLHPAELMKWSEK